MTTPVASSVPHSPRRRPTARTLAGIGLILVASLLYAVTLDNGFQPHELHGGDLITHQYAQVEARPGNAPGYPLYTLGGWIWFHSLRALLRAAGIVQPNPIPLLSSYSTLWALTALWLLYRLLCETTVSVRRPAGNWPAALLLSLFYAVTFFFWYYATTTEQYSSAIAQTLAIVYLFILWERAPNSHGLLFALAFLCGLSLAHMLTVALIVPPVVVAVLWKDPGLLRSPRAVLGSLLAAGLPLLSYSYVYWRGAQHPEWWGEGEWQSAAQWFLAFVSTAQGREELLWGFERGRSFFGNGFPQLIASELSVPMLALGLLGIAWLKRPLPFVLYSTLALYALFSWAYRYGNWFQVILPAYPLILLGAGAAVDRVQSLAQAYDPSPGAGQAARRRRWMRAALVAAPLVVVSVAIAWRAPASLPAADSHNRPQDTALQHAAVFLDQPLPPNVALFASVDDALALQYLTRIWSLRPDVTVVSSDQADATLADAPVLTTWDAAPTLLAEASRAPAASLHALSPDWLALVPPTTPASSGAGDRASPWAAPQPSAMLDQTIAAGVTLAGYRVAPSPTGLPVEHLPAGTDITLYWNLDDAAWPADLAISVRPTLDGAFIAQPDGDLVQIDRAQPLEGLAALTDGARPRLLADPYRLRGPFAQGQEPNGVALIVYRTLAGGFEDVARFDLPLP